MTHHERQKAAITMAVRRALVNLGKSKIKSGEFFGMKQSQTNADIFKKAA